MDALTTKFQPNKARYKMVSSGTTLIRTKLSLFIPFLYGNIQTYNNTRIVITNYKRPSLFACQNATKFGTANYEGALYGPKNAILS